MFWFIQTTSSKSADRLTTETGSLSPSTTQTKQLTSTSSSSCDVKGSSSNQNDDKSMFLAEENLTIESLAKSLDLSGNAAESSMNAANHSLLFSNSVASSDDADKTMQMAGTEDTLTLSGIARNISEDYKKSKKEAAAAAVSTSTSTTSSSALAKRGRRGRRVSSEGTSGKTKKNMVKNEPHEEDDFDDVETGEDESKLNNDDTGTTDDEPKPKKKQTRASSDLEVSSSTSKSTASGKRKGGIKTENESDSQESTTHSFKLNQFTADDLEVNQLVEVKYGHGKTTYQAKIVQIEPEDKTVWVHYLGWNNRYDEWIEIGKIIRIFSDDQNSNKRRKPTKPSTSTITPSTSSRRNGGASSQSTNDLECNKSVSSSKKKPSANDTPKTTSSSSKRSSHSSQSSISLENTPKEEERTPTGQSGDNLLSIKEEILEFADRSGAIAEASAATVESTASETPSDNVFDDTKTTKESRRNSTEIRTKSSSPQLTACSRLAKALLIDIGLILYNILNYSFQFPFKLF